MMNRCSRCDSEAVHLSNSDRKLYCKEHFFTYLEDKFAGIAEEYGMIEPHDKVLVAMSGGKDSSVLGMLLKKLNERRHNDIEVIGITVDKGIRDVEDSFDIIAGIAKTIGIPLYIIRMKSEWGVGIDDVALLDRSLTCAYCGELRRFVMDTAGSQMGATKIALGWTLDDMSIFLTHNLYKNTPLRLTQFLSPCYPDKAMLGGKKYKYPVQITPLRLIPEKEIALYAYLKKLKIHASSKCPYPEPSKRGSPGWWRYLLNRNILTLSSEFPTVREEIIRNFDRYHLPVYIRSAGQQDKITCPKCKKGFLPEKGESMRISLMCPECLAQVGVRRKVGSVEYEKLC